MASQPRQPQLTSNFECSVMRVTDFLWLEFQRRVRIGCEVGYTGPVKEGVSGWWKDNYINLYSSLNRPVVSVTDHIKACHTLRAVINANRILVETSERKRSLGRPIRRWEEKKWHLKGAGCEGVHWINLAQDRTSWLALVNTVMNFRVPKKAGIFLTSWGTVSFSRMTLLCGVRWWTDDCWSARSRCFLPALTLQAESTRVTRYWRLSNGRCHNAARCVSGKASCRHGVESWIF
jgi:hypothetical protein